MARRLPASIDDVTRVVGWVWSHPGNRDKRVRSLLSAVRFRARAAIGRSTVVGLGERSRIVAELTHANSIVAAYGNPPDYWEWRSWAEILRPGDLFVDVGANVGIYSILAAEMGCRVLAFEPDPANLVALRRNVALNGMENSITVIPKAVSSHVGSIGFLLGHDALARITMQGDGDAVPVPCTTLDAEVDEPIRGLKIDVEGAELDVLRGSTRLLTSRSVHCIQLEWNDMAEANYGTGRDETQGLLQTCGYRMQPELGLEAEADESAERVNVFFVPEDD